MKTGKQSLVVIFIMVMAVFAGASTAFCGETLVITEAGNVGIGTETPANELQIKSGGVDSDVLTIQQSGSSTVNVFSVKEDSSGNAGLSLKQSSGTTAIQLNAASDADSYISTGGKVGIGTTTPETNLHIAKDAPASSTLGGAPAVLMLEQANNDNWCFGDACGEILFKKGDDIVSAIRSEHMRGSVPCDQTNEDAGLTFWVAPSDETPVAFEAMRITYQGRVGIGTKSPETALDVIGTARAQVADGSDALTLRNAGNGGSWKLRLAGDATTANNLYIDNTNLGGTAMMIRTNGNVGIGKTNPSYKLDVNGVMRATNVSPSDIRLKEDIHTCENALDKVAQLRGVTFRWKDETRGTNTNIGVIAQEVEQVFPEVVMTDNEGYKSVAYANLVAPLIEAIKELKAENDTLKADISEIKAQLKNQGKSQK